MNEIKKKIFETYAKVRTDAELFCKHRELYDCLSELLDELRQNYLIVSKKRVELKSYVDVLKPNPLTVPDEREMRMVFSVTSKANYLANDLQRPDNEMLKEYLTNIIFDKLEEE